jgi:hypothetical protein
MGEPLSRPGPGKLRKAVLSQDTLILSVGYDRDVWSRRHADMDLVTNSAAVRKTILLCPLMSSLLDSVIPQTSSTVIGVHVGSR